MEREAIVRERLIGLLAAAEIEADKRGYTNRIRLEFIADYIIKEEANYVARTITQQRFGEGYRH